MRATLDLNTPLAVLEAGTDKNGANANTDFTSDEICMEDKPWSLVFTFTSLSVTGQYPTVEIQGCNDPDVGANNWESIFNGGAKTLPRTFKSRFCEFRFIRLVYLSNGATAGTINVYLNQKMNVEK